MNAVKNVVTPNLRTGRLQLIDINVHTVNPTVAVYNDKGLMATNCIDIVDQALLRPGRINKKIEFPNPNEDGNLLPDKKVVSFVDLVYSILSKHSFSGNITGSSDVAKGFCEGCAFEGDFTRSNSAVFNERSSDPWFKQRYSAPTVQGTYTFRPPIT
ncbi:hypothetical protein CTI12_AA003010 [Artemisia annua]|uniref:Uncharacterized protein n=1 Tax=Artemisia annua TaxID=35608 RepID=A0A2U1QP45_ARTAN|nr:hypothetical protein CTI12_AA003010 [Artemisia annua]